MAEYSKLAKGHFTSTGAGKFINLPFVPTRVELTNYTVANSAAASQNIASAKWDVSMGQGYAVIEGYNATPALIYDTVTSNGISSFQAGLSLQYGSQILLGAGAAAGIAKTDASTLTVTTTSAHGLKVGDWVTFQNLYQTATTGMQQIAGIPFIIKAVGSTTTFTVVWNGTAANLTALTLAATGAAAVKKILYPQLYVPGIAFPWSISRSGSVVTVKTTAPTNFVVGQQIAFNIPSNYGASQLNELPNNVIPASPNTYYVTEVGSVASDSSYSDYFKFNYSGSLDAFSVAGVAFASFPGLGFAIVKAVGDVNSGGYPYAGENLYPSPTVVYGNTTTTLLSASTINGPAIQGAYINNTSQGFSIGAGAGTVLTTGKLVGAEGNVIYWVAYYDDYSVN